MEKAAPSLDYQRLKLSFQGTRQLFIQTLTLLATADEVVVRQERIYAHLLKDIADDALPLRPHRQEPRVVKRRPQAFPRMRAPRAVLQSKLAAFDSA